MHLQKCQMYDVAARKESWLTTDIERYDQRGYTHHLTNLHMMTTSTSFQGSLQGSKVLLALDQLPLDNPGRKCFHTSIHAFLGNASALQGNKA